MSHRFYIQPPVDSSQATLTGPEAHHLKHVMRAQIGDEVTLFDGLGIEYRGAISRFDRQTATLQISAREEKDRELPLELTLAVALPKGDRQKMLVEKATELGVTRLVPLATERSVAQPTGSALERLARSVIEACKQCGRNRLMKIDPPQRLEEFLSGGPSGVLRLLAHPSGSLISPATWSPADRCELLIGPEGGFSDTEVTAAREAGVEAVSLGPRILRIETAAIALAALAATSLSR